MKKIEEMIGKKVIARSCEAGVYYGILNEFDNGTAEIINARNLWRWKGANCLMDLSTSGVASPNECKFSVEVKSVVICGVCELLECTQEAIESIEGVAEWKIK